MEGGGWEQKQVGVKERKEAGGIVCKRAQSQERHPSILAAGVDPGTRLSAFMKVHILTSHMPSGK